MNVKWTRTACGRQQEKVSLLVAGLLSGPEKAAVEAHLKACPRCQRYWRELTELVRGISKLRESVAEAVPSEELRARWTRQVLEDAQPAKGGISFHAQILAFARRWLSPPRPALAWGSVVAIGVAIVLAAGHWRTERERASAATVLQNPALVRELLAMFPHRVRAITQDERGLNLVLSENGDLPASSPLYVRIWDGRHRLSAVTFSGQEIQLAGQKISVLADTRGKMILVGENLLWSEKSRICPNSRWEIETKDLGSVPM